MMSIPYHHATVCASFRYYTVLDTNIKNNISVKNDWPKWILPTEEETYQLTKIITKYIRFLSPDIIQRIVIENEK